MLDFALVVTFSGVTHVNYFRRHRRYRRGWRAPEARFSRVRGLCFLEFVFASFRFYLLKRISCILETSKRL